MCNEKCHVDMRAVGNSLPETTVVSCLSCGLWLQELSSYVCRIQCDLHMVQSVTVCLEIRTLFLLFIHGRAHSFYAHKKVLKRVEEYNLSVIESFDFSTTDSVNM